MVVRKILVPVDFSAASDGVLEYAMHLADKIGAELDVLHVVTPPPFVPLDVMLWSGPDERLLAELGIRLDQRVAALKGNRSVIVTTRIESGVPPDTILNAAESADLVVMGTHGRRGMSHVVLGSVAERTLRFARCPVLVVPLSTANAMKSAVG